MKVRENSIEETDKYAYLGERNNKRMNFTDHIKLVDGKVEAAYQTILAVAEDRECKGIQMKCIWKLVKTCIIQRLRIKRDLGA